MCVLSVVHSRAAKSRFGKVWKIVEVPTAGSHHRFSGFGNRPGKIFIARQQRSLKLRLSNIVFARHLSATITHQALSKASESIPTVTLA